MKKIALAMSLLVVAAVAFSAVSASVATKDCVNKQCPIAKKDIAAATADPTPSSEAAPAHGSAGPEGSGSDTASRLPRRPEGGRLTDAMVRSGERWLVAYVVGREANGQLLLRTQRQLRAHARHSSRSVLRGCEPS